MVHDFALVAETRSSRPSTAVSGKAARPVVASTLTLSTKRAVSLLAVAPPTVRRAWAAEPPLRFGLTPVFLTSDLVLLDALKAYLAGAMDRPVQLVSRRNHWIPNLRGASLQKKQQQLAGEPHA